MTDVIYAVTPRDSLEVTRTSRGDVSFSLKVFGSPEEIEAKMKHLLLTCRITQAAILIMEGSEKGADVPIGKKGAKAVASKPMEP